MQRVLIMCQGDPSRTLAEASTFAHSVFVNFAGRKCAVVLRCVTRSFVIFFEYNVPRVRCTSEHRAVKLDGHVHGVSLSNVVFVKLQVCTRYT